MRRRFRLSFAVLALLLGLVASWGALAAPAAAAPVPVPKIAGWVTDLTGTLDDATKARINTTLADLESRKGAQIAVLMVPTLGSEDIESYARRVFDQWRVGRKKVDDGILLVIAKNDRRLRIEVGYGLEGAVPDILAGRIIREQIAPRFKEGDFAGGVVAGVDSLVKLVDGESLPPPAKNAATTGDGESPVIMLLPLAAMSFVMPVGMAGVMAGVFVYLMFENLALGLLGAVLGVVISLVGRAMGAGGRGNAARMSRRGTVIGGLGGLGGGFGGRGGGGFGGGGGLGGGGFGGGGGGGGGSSGGGGASGSW